MANPNKYKSPTFRTYSRYHPERPGNKHKRSFSDCSESSQWGKHNTTFKINVNIYFIFSKTDI